VLYVEDNLPNQRLMQDLLATRGDLELIVTDDPQQALSIACEQAPALLLLDIQLPGIDGYELLSLMRSRGVAVPVIAVSANAMPRDVERGRAAGFVEYLTKPLDLRRVLETVQAWVPPPV
jgi:CheY-like chemotaxis protein